MLILLAIAAALAVYYVETRLGWNPGAWALPQSALIGYLVTAPRPGRASSARRNTPRRGAPAGLITPRGRQPARYNRNVNEDEWQRQVIDTAHIFGWRVAHFRPLMTKHGWRTPVAADGTGFPDLILVRDSIIAVELKTDDARSDLTAEQRIWLLAFEEAGVENHVWRPRDAETVMQRLARRREQ